MKLGNPYFLATLWIIPALALFYIWSFKKKAFLIERFVSQELKERLLSGVSPSRQRFKVFLIVAGCSFTILAMLQPQWGFHWEETKRRGVDIVLALDVSKSMLAEDVSPNRLERAKRKISDFLKVVQGDRIGLIAFAGTAFLQCPLTLDHGAVQLFLDAVDTDLIPVPGTSIAAAIDLAIQSLQSSERNSRALILITDGEETTGSDLEAAKAANAQGIKIYTIGIGKEEGAPIPNREGGGFKKDRQGNVILTKLDEQGLQKVALETGGSYVRSVSGDLDLEKIYADLKKHTEDKELKSGRQKRFEERFQWPLFFAFLCFLIEAIVSERKGARIALPMLVQKLRFRRVRPTGAITFLVLAAGFIPGTIFGASARDGEKLYGQQKYNDALKALVDAQIENPTSTQLKYNTANAYYKTNQFPEAEKLFQSVAVEGDRTLSEKAYYNLGNTSYRQGKLQEALAYYQKASELDPKDKDAKFNLEFVRKEIRRRMNENQKQQGQPKPQPGGKGQDKKQQEQQQKNSPNNNEKQSGEEKKNEQKSAAQDQAKAGEKKDKDKDQSGAQGQAARKMSDEEAKQWLSNLKEADRSKLQKQQQAQEGERQYEVEKDW